MAAETEFARSVRAHASHYAGLLEREGPRLNGAGEPDEGRAQCRALQLLGAEQQNILVGLSTALALEEAPVLQTVARWFLAFMKMTGQAVECIEPYERMLELATRERWQGVELLAHLGLGAAYTALGDHARARQELNTALVQSREQSYDGTEARALGSLGNLHFRLLEMEPALDLFARASELVRQQGDRSSEAALLGTIGTVYLKLGDLDRAFETQSAAAEICRAIGDHHGQAHALGHLAGIQFHLNQVGAARLLLEQALQLDREMGYRQLEAIHLGNLGIVLQTQGELTQAIEVQLRALQVRQAAGDRHGTAHSLGELALTYAEQGDSTRALELCAQAFRLRQSMDDKGGMLLSCGHMLSILLSLAAWPAATVGMAAWERISEELGLGQLHEMAADQQHRQARVAQALADGHFEAGQLGEWKSQGGKLGLVELADFLQLAGRQVLQTGAAA